MGVFPRAWSGLDITLKIVFCKTDRKVKAQCNQPCKHPLVVEEENHQLLVMVYRLFN